MERFLHVEQWDWVGITDQYNRQVSWVNIDNSVSKAANTVCDIRVLCYVSSSVPAEQLPTLRVSSAGMLRVVLALSEFWSRWVWLIQLLKCNKSEPCSQ